MRNVRAEQMEALASEALDVLIIGGGINGAGTLRDLALRAHAAGSPLRFGLIEKNHFASGTSGKNSQLIHGGLRYLKYGRFGLVRESLRERATLLRIAAEYVAPLPFLLPMYGWKSRLLYGTGLALYDMLAASQSIRRHRILTTEQLARIEPELSRAGLTAAALFFDCRVHSARLVLANINDAVDHGAMAANYVEAKTWEREQGYWRVRARDTLSGREFDLRARKLVDATGAWSTGASLRLVRGSHIVIPRVNASDNAISYFDPSGRIVFLIPWGSANQLTLVGTTDLDHATGPDQVQITPEETAYLLGIVERLFRAKPRPEVIATYSSLRPLLADAASSPTGASREHRIWNSADGILHIAGGKYTTYRAMSEEAAGEVCREIAPTLVASHRTERQPLPRRDEQRERAWEQHLRDHLYVSTYLGYERKWDSAALRPYAECLGARLNWDEQRLEQEMDNIIGQSTTVMGSTARG